MFAVYFKPGTVGKADDVACLGWADPGEAQRVEKKVISSSKTCLST